MLGILFKAKVKPEKRAAFIKFFESSIRTARDCEPGTLRFDLYQDPAGDGNVFIIYEAYVDEKAFEEDWKGEPYRRWVKKIQPEMLAARHEEIFNRDAVSSLADCSSNLNIEEKNYGEICTNIRARDDISFKLIGLIPFLSGAGITVAILNEKLIWSHGIFLLSILGAAVTLGIFRWELRNIQRCLWLESCASDIECKIIPNGIGQFYRLPKAPRLFFWKLLVGKECSEKFIYALNIAAWLLLPVLVRSAAEAKADHDSTTLSQMIIEQPGLFLLAAVVIVLFTILSLLPINKEPEAGSR